MFEKYYHRLNLKPPVTDAEIRKAYRHLAKCYHPDGSGSAGTREKFQEITAAYNVLKHRHALWQRQFITYYLRLKEIEAAERGETMAGPVPNFTVPPATPMRNSHVQRLQRVLYEGIDYCFLLLCAFLLVFPFYRLLSAREFYWQLNDFLPAIIGLFFAFLCLYFSFYLPWRRRRH